MNSLGLDSHDILVLMDTGFPIPVPESCVLSALEQVHKRIGCGTAIGSPDECKRGSGESFPDLLACFESLDRYKESRVVVLPFGVYPILPWVVRSASWFGRLADHTELFFGDPITSSTIGEWLSVEKSARPSQDILIEPTGSLTECEVELLVASVFWANRAQGRRVRFRAGVDLIDIRSDGQDRRNANETNSGMRVPWRPRTVENRPSSIAIYSENVVGADDWLDPGMVANWIIESFLKATRGRAFPSLFPSDDRLDAEWKMLSELQRRVNLHLPSEYAGTQDSVSPNSMGSAALHRDSEGKVPWDKIWTSFCDLAMAGGPPHRGKLLESVDIDTIRRSPDQYRLVVSELRRGIQLAAGLETIECSSLGWVGVQCETEVMAAWLLRAILVENVIVRREGATLFLPAGPDFRVEKEIKNVITAVAKTVHYWRSHLRSRQPPKPL
ncbi:MAG: hypothetical protein FJ308_16160 [Planctomycetes bacterium]|nr:hypothetical protein [Planctomycetota bacterium]